MDKKLKEDIENQLECVICKENKVKIEYFPFCSDNCRLADLYNWLSGEYIIKEEKYGI